MEGKLWGILPIQKNYRYQALRGWPDLFWAVCVHHNWKDEDEVFYGGRECKTSDVKIQEAYENKLELECRPVAPTILIIGTIVIDKLKFKKSVGCRAPTFQFFKSKVGHKIKGEIG